MASHSHLPTTSKNVFPLEIFRLIFDHSDFATLKCLRSLCRAMEGEIAARIFRCLHFDLLPRSLELARSIAGHPSLGKYVQELIVSDNVLREYNYEDFRRQLCFIEPGSLAWFDPSQESTVFNTTRNPDSDLIVSKKWCRQSFDIYSKYVEAQRDIVSHEAKLPSIFPKLTRLKKIWLRTLDDIEQSRSWVALSMHVFGTTDIFTLRLWTTILSSDKSISALHMVLFNVRHIQHSVHSVKIDCIPSHSWYTYSISEQCSSLVNLDIRLEQGRSERKRVLVRNGIRQLLESLISIEFLRLEFTPSCGYYSRFDFGEIFLDVKLTMLQELHIHTGIIKSSDLLALCTEYRDSLQYLSITDFHLKDSSWENFYPLIVESLPNVSIMFEGLTSGDGWTTHTALPFGQRITFSAK